MAYVNILVPVRNEEDNVQPLVRRLDSVFSKNKLDYKLIFIDDHSTDQTIPKLAKLQQKYPIIFETKQGKPGKAFSILEGAKLADSEYVVMIDADLQYPPEVIPQMLEMAEKCGMVVARRISAQDSKFRRFLSKGFQHIFGNLMFGLKCDVQSGLKVLKRSILLNTDPEDVTPWTLDIPMLMTGLDMGYTIGEVEIEFAKRNAGASKIHLVQSISEIGSNAVKYRLKSKKPILIPSHETTSSIGAGLYHKRRKFITHSSLHHTLSALQTFSLMQKMTFLGIGVVILVGVLLNFLLTLKILVAILSFIYFVDVIFNLFLIVRSLHSPPELKFSAREIQSLKDKDLPIYSVLCPLYKEAEILPHYLDAMAKMDWPKDKLEVLLLLEEDDVDTIEATKTMNIPKYVKVVVVPDSQPKTKPKACNYGLQLAKGEYMVIYDAEDIPDPLQLKKAFLGFQKSPENVRCLQAKLNYHNPHQNLLTRFFTAEYSLWFDVILTGLQTVDTTIPLGGTSNHFKTAELRTLQGWDPFNVTEDCDLGIRLFKNGGKTAIIDSITLEEANSSWKNWLRQRSRWIKGYMQTYLIHMRHPLQFVKAQGVHALLFQLTVGGKIAFMLINPIMWFLTVLYFGMYAWFGPAIESLFPTVVFYMAVTSLLFGNFMFIYYYMIGVAKREHWTVMKWVYLVPVYWLMVSVAASIALYQLIVKPHYWEKTVHGLHLKKKKVEKEVKEASKDAVASVLSEAIQLEKVSPTQSSNIVSLQRFKEFLKIRQIIQYRFKWKGIFKEVVSGKYKKGTLLVVATMLANVLNMLTNFYMGHALKLEDFAVFNTYLSILGIITTFSSAFSATVNQKTASFLGRIGKNNAKNFWKYLKNRMVLISTILTIGWLFLIPTLTNFLNFDNFLPLILFTPIIALMGINSTNQGYLKGSLAFDFAAFATVAQPLARLIVTILFGESDLRQFAYISIPAGVIASTVVSTYFARKGDDVKTKKSDFRLPQQFLLLALISNLSGIAFFSLDNIFVASYLSAEETGLYGIMGLLGKMIFFSGTLITNFILPITAFQEGKGASSENLFKKLMFLTAFFSFGAFIVFGLLIPLTAPYLWGYKINAVRDILPFYCFGILLYTLAQGIVQFHLAKKHYIFALSSLFITIIQVVGLTLFHSSLTAVVFVMAISGFANLLTMYVLHIYYKKLETPLQNFKDFTDLIFGKFKVKESPHTSKDTYRILVLNWRDTKHVWAGGAEVYIHELSKKLVEQGHKVTVFCGNDGKSARNEVIDEVQMVRRGGFYTVYIWAFFYYVLRFRKHTDLIIDSENGIPFLTPLYVRKPIILLIHHIHQEIFRTQLRFPFSTVATFVEGKIMPYLYQEKQVVTVSESSKKEIVKLGLGNEDSIAVINPGIQSKLFKNMKKSITPSLVYVGRLKPYKNIDIAIKAFSKVLTSHPKAKFFIAGSGESLKQLTRLVKELNIEKSVVFLNSITDQDKVKLFATSWVAIQPSSIEGWGITVIEANACGTPVIASDVKGLRDSIHHQKTGVLVKPKDVDMFSEVIMNIFNDDKKRLQLSDNAKKWSEGFSWEDSSGKFQNIIHSSIWQSDLDGSYNYQEGHNIATLNEKSN